MESSVLNHLFSMRTFYLFTFLSFSFFGQSQNGYKELFGDSIKEINWTVGLAYLPSVNGESIALKATPTSLTIIHSETTYKRRRQKHKKRKIRLTKSEFVSLYKRYVELSAPIVNIRLSENEKDSLRRHVNDTLYNGSKSYKLTSDQLETYLAQDSFPLDMSVFKIDSVQNSIISVVIDGGPFWIEMNTLKNDNDTTQFTYRGNIVGSDEFRDLNKHLIISTLNYEFDIFKKVPFDYYFSRSTYYGALLQYMEGNEGLLEFIPFRLLLDDFYLDD